MCDDLHRLDSWFDEEKIYGIAIGHVIRPISSLNDGDKCYACQDMD